MNAVERVTVSSLKIRYDVVIQTVYSRLKALGIQPIKEGRSSFIEGEDITLMDTCDEFFKKNPFSTMDAFLSEMGLKTSKEKKTDKQPEPELDVLCAPFFAEEPPKILDFFETCEKLELLAEKGWKMPSKEVANLLGLSIETVSDSQRVIHRNGFVLKASYRPGTRKLEWLVRKSSD